MKKLLIATDCYLPRWDGIARFLKELLPEIKDEYEIEVVAPAFPGVFTPTKGINETLIPITKFAAADYLFPKFALKAVKKKVKEADIVWTQTIGPIGASAIHYGKAMNKPVIAYIHSIEWELFSKSLFRANIKKLVIGTTKSLARYLYNKCTLLLVPSFEVGELMKKNGIRTPTKPVLMGVNTNHFYPPKNKSSAKEFLGLPSRARVIGYCGRIGREKDIVTLYRAFLRLRHKIGEARLIIAGGGVKDYDSLLKSKQDIIHVGPKNNLLPYYQALDVFVLPSLTETSSLVTMEAMSTGVPVVVTKVGHVKEYVEENKNGMFFNKRDSFQLYVILQKLLRDDVERQRLGRNARKTILDMYSFEKTVKDVKFILSQFSELD